jgi:large subunit ribosomal protein LP0
MSDEGTRSYNARKTAYKAQVEGLLNNYSKVLVVDADNVTSQQMHEVRASLRGKAIVLMGKNTLVRFIITNFAKETGNVDIMKLANLCRLNVGLVFTNESLQDVRDLLLANKKQANARVGLIAPIDVTIPAGPTSLEPTQTSFFQALQIPTKINKGSIEILSDVKIIQEGKKCGASEVALLNKLNVKPFSYGLVLKQVYEDGSTFGPEVLDMTEEDIGRFLSDAISDIASLSLQTGLLNSAAIPHLVANAAKDCIAVCAATSYSFKQAEEILEFLKDPSKFAVAGPVSTQSAAPTTQAAPEPEEEEEEEEADFSLFD